MKFILIAGIAFFVWLIVKLCQSPKFDKFCKDLFSGKLDTETTTKETIKDIAQAEAELSKQVNKFSKKSEKLKQEIKIAQEYLHSRGAGGTDKEGSG